MSLGALLWEGTDEVVASSGACVACIKSDLANCRKVMYSGGEVEDCKNSKIITKYIRFPIDFGIYSKSIKHYIKKTPSKVEKPINF